MQSQSIFLPAKNRFQAMRSRLARGALQAVRTHSAAREHIPPQAGQHRRAGSPRGILFGSATFSTLTEPLNKRPRLEEASSADEAQPQHAAAARAALHAAYASDTLGFSFSAGGLLFPYYVRPATPIPPPPANAPRRRPRAAALAAHLLPTPAATCTPP